MELSRCKKQKRCRKLLWKWPCIRCLYNVTNRSWLRIDFLWPSGYEFGIISKYLLVWLTCKTGRGELGARERNFSFFEFTKTFGSFRSFELSFKFYFLYSLHKDLIWFRKQLNNLSCFPNLGTIFLKGLFKSEMNTLS